MTMQTKTIIRSAPKSDLVGMRNRFARDIIFGLLTKMSRGRLEVVLTDGTKKVFGNEASAVTASLKVHDDAMFWRCLLYADIGLAESYMDGLCDVTSIADVIAWFLLNQEQSPVLRESAHSSRLLNLLGFINKIAHAFRRNSKSNSARNIADHYDLGNDFFTTYLDKTMTYSSALFANLEMNLETAQRAKFERIACKLKVEQSDKVLDLGCGWGGLSVFLAKTFHCSVTAVTISREQHDYVSALIKREQLEDLIDLRLEDYRQLTGKFDKIASVEMIEAVGEEYLDLFVRRLDNLLAPNGLLCVQMITCPDSRYAIAKSNVDFIQKHIFPGSLLPSLYRVNSAMLAAGDLFMVDLLDMTASYVITLERWQRNYEKNLSALRSQGFDERFIRKWRYYFEYCQAAFNMRNVSVVQALYSRPNNRRLAGQI